MKFLSCFHLSIVAISLFTAQAFGEVVAYRFTGLLNGYYYENQEASNSFPFPIATKVDVDSAPFVISIYGDLSNVESPGHVPGGGRLWVNNSANATWSVVGIGSETSDIAQIYAIGGIFRVGFSWDGTRYPFGEYNPFFLEFSSGDIRSYNQYGRLSGVGDPISAKLVTSFTNPPGTISISPSNTSILIGDTNLWLTDLSEVKYSITPVPLPTSFFLFASAIVSVFSARSYRPNKFSKRDSLSGCPF